MKLRTLAALGVVLNGAVLFIGWGSLDSEVAASSQADTAANAASHALAAIPQAMRIAGLAEPTDLVNNTHVVDSALLSPQMMWAGASYTPQDVAPADTRRSADPQIVGAVREAAVVAKSVEPKWDKSNGVLTSSHIAQIKSTLRLTAEQEANWRPVESALREIGRKPANQNAAGRPPKIAISPEEAQQLYWTAGPLLMSLREDQKTEVRRLARALGLEQVASLI